jgi:hypothetical protein
MPSVYRYHISDFDLDIKVEDSWVCVSYKYVCLASLEYLETSFKLISNLKLEH